MGWIAMAVPFDGVSDPDVAVAASVGSVRSVGSDMGRWACVMVRASWYSISTCCCVRGHEKVPTGGQVVVSVGGQLEVPTVRVVS